MNLLIACFCQEFARRTENHIRNEKLCFMKFCIKVYNHILLPSRLPLAQKSCQSGSLAKKFKESIPFKSFSEFFRTKNINPFSINVCPNNIYTTHCVARVPPTQQYHGE